MNWDAISAVSEMISSIAVIVSLLYLAQQIRQSNKLSKGQTRVELRHMASAELQNFIAIPEIQISYYKESLTEEEKVRLNAALASALRFREFIWRQYQEGLLDKPTFETYSRVIIQILDSSRCRKWWERTKQTNQFDPAFVTFVDKLLADNPSTPLTELWKTL